MHDPLLQTLVRFQAIDAQGIARALGVASETGDALDVVVTKLGLLSERDLAAIFCKALALPLADLPLSPPQTVQQLELSPAFARRARVVPIQCDATTIELAMANPMDDYVVESISLVTGLSVRRSVATATDIEAMLDRLFPPSEPAETPGASKPGDLDLDRLRDLASDAPTIRLVNQIITQAVDTRASDIHIEPANDRLVIRLRIDGIMREIATPSARLRDAVVSRVKIMAKLNIAERRLPQDGRMSTSVRGTEIDFRVSTVPTVHGESVVIRVLDRDQVALDFDALGFDDTALRVLRPLLALPNGILLVTGPTGSGKTTTLYAAIATLNVPERKIMTIEDPVEYQLDGVNQVQVQPNIGLTFAWALRSFLRQNPNIVMVGEIRDLETAQVAVQVALTGHMILSTLHTNDAASGITRLLDMGVEDYLLVSTVNAIMAQRLVRTLCRACREPYELPTALATALGLSGGSPLVFHRAKGCAECGGSGFRGRTTIMEILPVTDAIRELVLARASAGAIHVAAVDAGMRTMQAHGLAKAAAGITSIEEVLTVTRTG